MSQPNRDLLGRLRHAGIRKPVAKALSELTGDAGKQAIGAGHRAVAELRSLADEIEKRLPASEASAQVAAAGTPRTSAKAKKASAPEKASAPTAALASARPATTPAPRGANRAKILEALKTGPHTASEISQQTGIAASTVSTSLTRLAKSGEVSKASRGYSLPS